MKEVIEERIQEDLYKVTDYNQGLKQEIWGKLVKEMNWQDEALPKQHKKSKSKFLTRLILVAACSVILIGGTVMATPLINYLQHYFGKTKVQDVYDIEKQEFVRSEGTLYVSELGYTTFYNEGYFDIVQKENSDKFVAKEGEQEASIEITLIKDKDFETVLNELTGQKPEEIYDTSRVKEVKWETDSNTGLKQVTCLSDAKELGVFVMQLTYSEKDDIGSGFCYHIKNQFTTLDEGNVSRVQNGKPQISFEYDTEQYEVIRYRTDTFHTYLQIKGSDIYNMNNVLFSYSYHIDESSELLIEQSIKSKEKQKVMIKEMIEEEEDAEKLALFASSITTETEVPTDLEVPSRKVVETFDVSGENSHVTYYIEDGQGGCYEVFIYQPYLEALQDILKSIKVVYDEEEIIPVLEIMDEAVG